MQLFFTNFAVHICAKTMKIGKIVKNIMSCDKNLTAS